MMATLGTFLSKHEQRKHCERISLYLPTGEGTVEL